MERDASSAPSPMLQELSLLKAQCAILKKALIDVCYYFWKECGTRQDLHVALKGTNRVKIVVGAAESQRSETS
jgi:hypothetical protein